MESLIGPLAHSLWNTIENHIRGYVDNDGNGEIIYVCTEPFAIQIIVLM